LGLTFLDRLPGDLPAAGSVVPPVQPAEAPKPVDLLWGIQIPMRDGIRLGATIYKPRGQKDPLPAIFTLTPYIADSYLDRALYFAMNGYVFALVDVRGRGNSDGRFEPNANESDDGYDVVEWLSQQPWCDGRVAMWGGSYAGHDQWATAKSFPPHLTTIVPAAAALPAVDFPFFHNIFFQYVIQWITFTSGVTVNTQLFSNSDFWISKFTEHYRQCLPFKDLDRVVGNNSDIFQKWVAHPKPDQYWGAMGPSSAEYGRIAIPILSITGHYDGDQIGALTYYRRHMQHATHQARESHFLIIGPWDHAGTRTPKKEVGGLTFGEASVLDLNRLHREWYDWTMKGGPRPEFLKKRVAYYLAGAEVWKYADSLDSISNETRTFYLSSLSGQANDAFRSGMLTGQKPGMSAPDTYTYDPLDTRPADFYQQEIKNFITDQTNALNLLGNGVVYHSEPFDANTEVTGQLRLVVWIAIDVPDTDFSVEVDEVKPNGTSIMLTTDLMRARYRDSLLEEKLVKPNEINMYEFNGFYFFSRQIAKGSRLRLVLNCPNSIFVEKNYNGGGVVASESGKDARTAHVTVYHDAEHSSRLEVPIVKEA